ncbi:MAG TPA: Appr-1-p processing protein, partial [Ignavibacteria bacterium]|nr:Appr-1-p processing protein [Ignavibacteria bacterium]
MGKGIALQFKQSFYDNFLQYKKSCMKHDVHIGEMFTYEIQNSILPKYIINFPTKQHWKDKSLIESIDSGLISLGKEIDRLDIYSIAIPLIGSGL